MTTIICIKNAVHAEIMHDGKVILEFETQPLPDVFWDTVRKFFPNTGENVARLLNAELVIQNLV